MTTRVADATNVNPNELLVTCLFIAKYSGIALHENEPRLFFLERGLAGGPIISIPFGRLCIAFSGQGGKPEVSYDGSVSDELTQELRRLLLVLKYGLTLDSYLCLVTLEDDELDYYVNCERKCPSLRPSFRLAHPGIAYMSETFTRFNLDDYWFDDDLLNALAKQTRLEIVDASRYYVVLRGTVLLCERVRLQTDDGFCEFMAIDKQSLFFLTPSYLRTVGIRRDRYCRHN